VSTEIRETVRRRYAEAATSKKCCCGGADCGDSDPITRDLYDELQRKDVPAAALEASLGCGNPTALAELVSGETVLDLGSGGGIDVILSARRVGPTGRAIGVDMTDEMLALARRNAADARISNVEFRKGEIEDLPLDDGEVDVVISNCVINLSVDKPTVLEEAFRVLKPGGRFAVSDVVARGRIPAEIRKSLEMWAGCVAGALDEAEYRNLLAAAGFEGIEIEPTRVYEADDVQAVLSDHGIGDEFAGEPFDGRLMAAFIRARKPID
jgi:arsenite methyltransferase